MPLTHEQLSRMMGVQRSTISLVMHALQAAGVIRQGRGAVTVTDRRGLEQTVCGCYELIRQQSKPRQLSEVRT
ncbi:helix-turn-helix domain-containing protein [Microvirga sp. VF16]|uniref:helix-turn-helix domain-containing protein n=1 Tax=Microvirga sp. VF16 TaxID=2807101 RepID=UPI001FED407F|nr:helix-turn-helix domain-containing protein [Microvirga sp. VF16]